MNPGQYVVFALGAEKFGLPIESVEQILTSTTVTHIPKTDEAILGVFELRGEILPVVDTRAILHLPPDKFGCFLVVSINGARIAFVADRVERIVTLVADQIEPNANLVGETQGTFIGKVDNRLIVLLEPSTLIPGLLSESERAQSPQRSAA